MERLWVGVKTFVHGIFKVTINIIGTPCLGMNIVFIRIGSFHQIMYWSHIGLHFGFKLLL